MSDKYGRRLRLSPEEVEFVYQKRASTLENINDNTALDTHLKERGIEKWRQMLLKPPPRIHHHIPL